MHPAPLQSSGPHKVKTCLLVDNTPTNLRLLDVMMEKMGIDATSVTSGMEALEELNERRYDLLIIDLWMPIMNGVELVELIRQDPRFTKLPILAITADPKFEENFDMTGFNGALLKPVGINILKEALLAVNLSLNTNPTQKSPPVSAEDRYTDHEN